MLAHPEDLAGWEKYEEQLYLHVQESHDVFATVQVGLLEDGVQVFKSRGNLNLHVVDEVERHLKACYPFCVKIHWQLIFVVIMAVDKLGVLVGPLVLGIFNCA